MQKTVATPYFKVAERTIVYIKKNVHGPLYEYFDKSFDINLQKMGANPTTRTVRQFQDKLVIAHNDAGTNKGIPVYGGYLSNSEHLIALFVDIIKSSPDTSSELMKNIKELDTLSNDIAKLKSRVDDRSIDSINHKEKQLDDLYKEIVVNTDMQRVAESFYYNIIRFIQLR